jgi:hypothetical protein
MNYDDLIRVITDDDERFFRATYERNGALRRLAPGVLAVWSGPSIDVMCDSMECPARGLLHRVSPFNYPESFWPPEPEDHSSEALELWLWQVECRAFHGMRHVHGCEHVPMST